MRKRLGVMALALLLGLLAAERASAQAPGLAPGSLSMSLAGGESKISSLLPTMTPLKNMLNWMTGNNNPQYTTITPPPPYQIDTAAYVQQFGMHRPQRLHLAPN
jgi:hypothetical protein